MKESITIRPPPVADDLESLQIEIRNDEVELELERLRLENRRLNDKLAERRRRFAVDVGTASSFAVAGVSIIAAAGVEPFFSTALALVSIVGAFFGLAKIASRPPAVPTVDD